MCSSPILTDGRSKKIADLLTPPHYAKQLVNTKMLQAVADLELPKFFSCRVAAASFAAAKPVNGRSSIARVPRAPARASRLAFDS
jgi:hypothetical protein